LRLLTPTRALGRLPGQLRKEIAHFFGIYKQFEGHEFRIEGWRSQSDVLEVIARAGGRHARRLSDA
jgi:inorganic pyrophosphatase